MRWNIDWIICGATPNFSDIFTEIKIWLKLTPRRNLEEEKCHKWLNATNGVIVGPEREALSLCLLKGTKDIHRLIGMYLNLSHVQLHIWFGRLFQCSVKHSLIIYSLINVINLLSSYPTDHPTGLQKYSEINTKVIALLWHRLYRQLPCFINIFSIPKFPHKFTTLSTKKQLP